jgi:hypothetical protein
MHFYGPDHALEHQNACTGLTEAALGITVRAIRAKETLDRRNRNLSSV